MAASSRVEPCKYDVLLLGYDRTLATGDADEEAIGRSEDFACTLVEYLETKCNLKVFFDCRDVDLGQSVFDARFDVFKKSKFIVPVMCPAFIQDCWSKYITESAFVDRLGSAQFIPVCVLGVTQQDTKDKLKNYRVIKCLYFKAEAVLPEDDLQALDKLRRALTAGVSQPVQDNRNNEGPGDVSNGEISDSAAVRPAPLSQNLSEGHANASEDRGPSLSPADWYSPVSPVPQTQSEVFRGLNREDRDCEATGEETAEERQGQDAAEDASGENSVRSWMGSLSSFPRDVALALWTCILYTENSTP